MEAKLIKQSFALMQPHADRIVRRAFQLLEERHRPVYSAFEGTDMERQYSSFTRALAFIAYNVHNKERLNIYLVELGQRHRGYGISPDDLSLLGGTLIVAMGECLGHNFSTEVKSEWEKTMRYVSKQMAPAAEKEETVDDGALGTETSQTEVEHETAIHSLNEEQDQHEEDSLNQPSTEKEIAKVIPLTKEQLENYSLPSDIKEAIQEQAQAAFQQAVQVAWQTALQEQEEKFKKLKNESPFTKAAG